MNHSAPPPAGVLPALHRPYVSLVCFRHIISPCSERQAIRCWSIDSPRCISRASWHMQPRQKPSVSAANGIDSWFKGYIFCSKMSNRGGHRHIHILVGVLYRKTVGEGHQRFGEAAKLTFLCTLGLPCRSHIDNLSCFLRLRSRTDKDRGEKNKDSQDV